MLALALTRRSHGEHGGRTEIHRELQLSDSSARIDPWPRISCSEGFFRGPPWNLRVLRVTVLSAPATRARSGCEPRELPRDRARQCRQRIALPAVKSGLL